MATGRECEPSDTAVVACPNGKLANWRLMGIGKSGSGLPIASRFSGSRRSKRLGYRHRAEIATIGTECALECLRYGHDFGLVAKFESRHNGARAALHPRVLQIGKTGGHAIDQTAVSRGIRKCLEQYSVQAARITISSSFKLQGCRIISFVSLGILILYNLPLFLCRGTLFQSLLVLFLMYSYNTGAKCKLIFVILVGCTLNERAQAALDRGGSGAPLEASHVHQEIKTEIYFNGDCRRILPSRASRSSELGESGDRHRCSHGASADPLDDEQTGA